MANTHFVHMLKEGLQILCCQNEFSRIQCGRFLTIDIFSEADVKSVLLDLSNLLLQPDTTLSVAHCFPQILLQLLSLAMDATGEIGMENNEEVEHKQWCVVLGKLARFHPDAVRFSLQYFENNPSPFQNVTSKTSGPTPKKKRRLTTRSEFNVTDLDVVVTCFNFLQGAYEHFRQLWNWSTFMNLYLGHKDDFVCWVACQCVATVLNMSELQRESLVSQYLSLDAARVYTLRFEDLQVATRSRDVVHAEQAKEEQEATWGWVSDSVVTVAGIQLPVFDPKRQKKDGSLVPVPSTMANLHGLALAVASGRAICLQGPVGCGKTALVEHMAQLTGRTLAPQFLKVQLGDQTDSKMLLGSYRCTDVPGEFVWQPGVLTQAVIGGHWILLEDIDSAATDVASVLTSLLETNNLTVPGYRDVVKAAPGFQLFVTQRLVNSLSSFQKQVSGTSSLLQKHLIQINIEPLSKPELVRVVQTLFPILKTIASRIVEVFMLFSVGSHDMALETGDNVEEDSIRQRVRAGSLAIGTTSSGGRLTSTRDLIKWCMRATEGFDVASSVSALNVFQDAIDIFCCSVPDAESRVQLAAIVGACLGIVRTKAEYFCNIHKPNIGITPQHFTAGRAVLRKQMESVAQLPSKSRSYFAFTRPAACLLERVARCVARSEPVLLVGETGTGKTSVVQYIAERTGHQLVVINMNQQSDSADLLGGYKPVDMKYIVAPVREEFEVLFRGYFSVPLNTKYLEHIATCFGRRKWPQLLRLMQQSHSAAMKRLAATVSGKPSPEHVNRQIAWCRLGERLHRLATQLNAQSALAFSFIEGSLVKALRKGYWVLLDEINLASAETLECLSGLLEGSAGSLYLLERGDQESIKRHPQFRLFACMNPATDVGKKDLPAGLRNRFTEFFVDELTEKVDLQLLVGTYLHSLNLPNTKLEGLVRFYLNICKEASISLTDGTGHKPHYSLRTLCRALSVAAQNPCHSVIRSLYEALCLSFLTQLDHTSHPTVTAMVAKAVLDHLSSKSLLKQQIPQPLNSNVAHFVCFEGYWVSQGALEPTVPNKYILTPSVRRNLHDLVRVVSLGHHPVLLQGETSVGKTSLIEYIARTSGNVCVRINNHEHTDLQEYVGAYCANSEGCLVFREGVLVEAMRKGHWIILDELNLAPTDVLEALNRVLDDNRELFIPETQETVKAHPQFMLFATQNPPGLYGGRKMLSRAFRNRFVELHFDQIPAGELETILHRRCDMPTSYCKKLVAVMTELQLWRRGSAAFAGKLGFITLRDLFRWGERYHLAQREEPGKYYDWDQHVADEGYLVLAGRVRKQEECQVIRHVLHKHMKREVDPHTLFTLNEKTSPVTRPILAKVVSTPIPGFEHIVWTYNMRRLAVLVGKAFQFQEPALLVGETGCGKTTVCQLLAATHKQTLYTINCHMHTESSDFLGGLRPVREHTSTEGPQKLFEWVDGPLIMAMRSGDLFLADEISLADDSVLERLNSLLEPERKLLLVEKGTDGTTELNITDSSCVVEAQGKFHFIGTMNPGGDYGKKELSPALRNRFTEIWCEGHTEREDLLEVIEHNLRPGLSLGNQQDGRSGIGSHLLDFLHWFRATDVGKRIPVSIRDILSWVNFMNMCTEDTGSSGQLDLAWAYVHGACLTFLDGFGSGSTSIDSASALKSLQDASLSFLMEQMELNMDESFMKVVVVITDTQFGVKPFYIERGTHPVKSTDFTFSAPTTGLNALRVLRALQLPKPILLEGSPGVGKTSLVAALAKASGHRLVRINVSDQTDVSDLFGADLPVEGGEGGQFAWRDGPFLQALKAGDWILLDELNLASQSVLEGLNACLDHRGEVFIPELGRTFRVQSRRTHLFGAQNPLRQGGARRGLPQSFLNRFTQVYVNVLTDADLEFIIAALYPSIPHALVARMVQFNARLVRETLELHLWGHRGGPWELNLRDLCRWCHAMVADGVAMGIDLSKIMEGDDTDVKESVPSLDPGKYVELIYVDRMRTQADKDKVKEIYGEKFGCDYPLRCDVPRVHVTQDAVYLGDVALSRIDCQDEATGTGSPMAHYITAQEQDLLLLRKQFPALRSLARCISMNWMAILVGSSGSGKTSVIRLLSQLSGRELRVLSVNSAMDTTEILGGFEQADYNRHLEDAAAQVERLLLDVCRRCLLGDAHRDGATASDLLRQFETFRKLAKEDIQTLAAETKLFCRRLEALQCIVSSLSLPQSTDKSILELMALEKRLATLAKKVKKDGSLNAGGKFEWVDSILVKCLLDGAWLLVDGVNLCSPAVLDRLNALLEPGGVLTIGERGVNSAGQLVTVTPHPNFRLFLAMDPRHGEISRAMRNRGVEICLMEGEDFCNLDQAALLASAGLDQHQWREALLAIHSTMAQARQDLDQPGISQLLHAAFLIAQQTVRGQPTEEAFLSACSDVYVKSLTRNLSGGDAKQRLYQILKVALMQHQPHLKGTESGIALEDCVPIHSVTVQTSKLQENSTVMRIKQQGSLITTVLNALTLPNSSQGKLKESRLSPNIKFLNYLLNVQYQDSVALTEILPYLILIFYETSTVKDIQFRHDWLANEVQKCKQKENIDLEECLHFVLSVSKVLKDTLVKGLESQSGQQCLVDNLSQICRSSDLPWDLRWLPELKDTFPSLGDFGYTGFVNKLSLHCYFAFLKNVEEFSRSKQSNERGRLKSSTVTIMQYSTAVTQGKVADNVTQHPLVCLFAPLLRQFDAYLQSILALDSVSLDPAQWQELLLALTWRFRFGAQGNMQLLRKSCGRSRSVDESVMMLDMHYHWLRKRTLPALQCLEKQDMTLKCNKLATEFHSTMHTIDVEVSSSETPLQIVGKRIRRTLGQPLPFPTEKQGNLAKEIDRLSSLLRVWPDMDPAHFSKQLLRVTFLLTPKGQQARRDLITASQLLRNRDNQEEVLVLIEKVKQGCCMAGLITDITTSPSEEINAVEEKKKKRDTSLDSVTVQLWPVQELLALILSAAFRREVMCRLVKHKSSQQNMESSSELAEDRMEVCESIPESMVSQEVAEGISMLDVIVFMQCLPSVPPSVVASAKEVLHLEGSNNDKEALRHVPELLMWMLRHISLSPANHFTKRWLTWKMDSTKTPETGNVENTAEWMDSMEEVEDCLPLHCPLLSSLVTSLTLPDEPSRVSAPLTDMVVTSTLGSHVASGYKLEMLQELLWRNMAALASPQLDPKLNDAVCAEAAYERFMQALQESLSDIAPAEKDKGPENSDFSQVKVLASKLRTHVEGLEEGRALTEAHTFADALEDLAKAASRLRHRTSSGNVHMVLATGQVWVLMGFLQVSLFSKFGSFDPVLKKALKLQYATEEACDVTRMLHAHKLQARVLGQGTDEDSTDSCHPYITELHNRLSLIEAKKKELEASVAFRPGDITVYHKLHKEIFHYTCSQGSSQTVLSLLQRLIAACHHLQCYQSLEAAESNLLREEKTWRDSQRIFCERLVKAYGTWYPDVLQPLLSAVTQMCHGTSLLASILSKLQLSSSLLNADDLFLEMVRFPSQADGLHLAQTCTSLQMSEVLTHVLGEQARLEKYRLLRSSLCELRNQVSIQGALEGELWTTLTALLSQLVVAWRQQEDERLVKEKERDSLFVTKGTTRCETLSEEQQVQLEMYRLFPTMVEQDFGDLTQEATLDATPKHQSVDSDADDLATGLIGKEDVAEICQLHSELLTGFTSTAWLAPGNSKLRPDFVGPLLRRYQTFHLVLDRASRGLDCSLDMRLAPSLTLVTHTARLLGRGSEPVVDIPVPGSPYRQKRDHVTDFYRDTNVEEVKQCLPLLTSLLTRTLELLDQWPEHPTLSQISTIVQRVLGFPVVSPVIRFLSGLELLLGKLREWEENAHAGVSLALHSTALTHQIVAWRKLELQCWKDCLSSVACRVKASVSRWWFHIYSLVEAFTTTSPTKEEEMSAQKLVEALQRFMEESTFGEFEARLNLLFSFHCHATYLKPTNRRDQLVAILWNLHAYYTQFCESVDARIRELRSPIEKKLKDYVKIARWNDISYWAIKQAVEKTHRTLHKHVKDFEGVLKRPALDALRDSRMEASQGAWDRPQRTQPRHYHNMVDPVHFVAAFRLKRFITSTDNEVQESVLLARASSLFTKARKLCKLTILASSYPLLVQSVDGLVTEIIETSCQLRNMEVSKDVSVAKQRAQVKCFLQQKKKALADLFRSLQDMGLSYRTGLALWNAQEGQTIHSALTLPPIDLKAAFHHLKSRHPDGQLLSVWEGCEAYFLRSVARLALLHKALGRPSKDLGPPAIERCRGFSLHLMVLAQEQKLKLIESSQLLCSLRCQVSQLTAMEDTHVVLPRQSELQLCLRHLKGLLATSIICLEQFHIFLQACPSSYETNFETPVLKLCGDSWMSPMVSATKGDATWDSAIKKIKNLILSVTKMKSTIEKSEIGTPFIGNTKSPNSLLKEELQQDNPEDETSLDDVMGSDSAMSVAGSVPKWDDTLVGSPFVVNTSILVTPLQYELMSETFVEIVKIADEVKNVREMFELKLNLSETKLPITAESHNPMVESLDWLESLMRNEVGRFKDKISNVVKQIESTDNISQVEIGDKELEISAVPPHEEEHNFLLPDTFGEDVTENNKNVHISLLSKKLKEADREKLVVDFRNNTEELLRLILVVIQEKYKKYTKEEAKEEEEGDTKKDKQETETTGDKDGEEESNLDTIEDNHLKQKVVKNLSEDVEELKMAEINDRLSALMQRLGAILDLENATLEGNACKRLLLRSIPCLEQLTLLCQFFITQQVAAYRVSCKMLSVLLSVFLDLAQKGFCIPPELAPGEEGGETEDAEGGMGLGEGEGEKDVSDRIESEDQLEDARPAGEEREEDNKDCKEEEKGIETSEDFGGKIQNLDEKEGEEGESEKSGDEEEPDKEMGDTETGVDKLDQQIWGSDSEGEGDDGEEEQKEEEGAGEQTGEQKLGAKDERKQYDENDEEGDGEKESKKEQKDINELQEPEVDDDHIDPYHGKHQPEPEPEPLDLPDDLQLDDGEAKDGGDEGEENPFDIDAMKEQKPPEVENAEEETPTEDKEDTKKGELEDSSDNEEEEEGGEGEKKLDDTEMETDTADKDGDEAGGGSKDEEKEGDKPKDEEEEQKDKEEETAKPSDDHPSETPAESAVEMEMDTTDGSKDQVSSTPQDQSSGQQPPEDATPEGGDEKQGVGQAQTDNVETGHRGELAAPRDSVASRSAQPEPEQRQEKRQRPGESDSNRSLGEVNEPIKKKLKTMSLSKQDVEEEKTDDEDKMEEEMGVEEGRQGDMYQHIKDAKESFDTQTLDAATKEQAEKQPVPTLEDEPGEEPSAEDDVDLHKDDPITDEQDVAQHSAEKVPSDKKHAKERDGEVPEEGADVEMRAEVEGERVDTLGAARGAETTFHTIHKEIRSDGCLLNDSACDLQMMREELERQLATWTRPPPNDEAERTWEAFSAVTSSLARDLSEQLRLVLEPTRASRLRGDYRTGRRINMRKVIPYIASQFRKDKIWLRRTKPSKREYQIVLAIDDSSSMADNHSKELAFESLALVSRALTLLEAGELAVVSFGETPQVLHRLGEPFTEQSGARLLQQFSFGQTSTRLGQLVDFSASLLSSQSSSSQSERAQLLVILSDGRGVFSEGPERVKLAIRRAKQAGIFMVFVIVDNPTSKDSVLDIRMPVFSGGNLVGIMPYLDTFPFPFYLILRDINALPAVLSDALRQWFELITNIDNQ